MFFLSLITFLLSSCKEHKTNLVKDISYSAEHFDAPYIFSQADEAFYLARSLTEISGLCYSPRSKSIQAINDEQGIIFYISIEDGEIFDRIDFGKSNDYEGITYHDGHYYIVESNGNIKVVSEASGKKVNEYKGILSRDQDIEGLCYSKVNNCILMAAKGDSRVNKNTKAIFKMNPSNGNIDYYPFSAINLAHSIKNLKPRNIEEATYQEDILYSRIKLFAPSGIAEHPVSGDLYILSSKGRLLVILGSDKLIKSVIFLNPFDHEQPEGICFDPKGNLYLSNEGKKKKPVLFKYSML